MRWLTTVAVLLVSAWVLSRHGFEAELQHDDAVNIYSAQQMLRGVPPFRSLFDHKAPLTTIVCAPVIALGDVFELDDVLAVRLAFLAIGSGVVALLFLWVDDLFGSRTQAILTGAVFLGLWGFGVQAASGAFPKTLTLFLVMAALWSTTRRSWLAAGASAALAALAWQPLGIYLLAVLLIAWGGRRPRAPRRGALLRALLGAAVPIALFLLYFTFHGALRELFDGMVLFNLRFLEPTGTVGRRLELMAYALMAFRWMGYALLVGTLALLPLYPARLRRARTRGISLLEDPFAPLLTTLPAPFLWSVIDFQAYPDMFVFLPYGALGFGWLLQSGIGGILEKSGFHGRAVTWSTGSVVGVTLAMAGFYYSATAPTGALTRQRTAWQEIVGALPHDQRIAAVGAPQVLALLERTNITPYGTVWRGIERYIGDRQEGGFEGWLETLGSADVLIVDRLYPASWTRQLRRPWFRFLAEHFEPHERLDRINVYVRKDPHSGAMS